MRRACISAVFFLAVVFGLAASSFANWSVEYVDMYGAITPTDAGTCDSGLIQIKHEGDSYATPNSDCRAIHDYVTAAGSYGIRGRAQSPLDNGRWIVTDCSLGEGEPSCWRSSSYTDPDTGIVWWETNHLELEHDSTVTFTYQERAKLSYYFHFDGAQDNAYTSSTWQNIDSAINYAIPESITRGGEFYVLTGWSGADTNLQSTLGSQYGTWPSPSGHSVSFTLTQDTQVNWLYKKAHNVTIGLAATPTLNATTLATLANPLPHSGTLSVVDGPVSLSVNELFYDDAAATDRKRYHSTGWSGGTGNLAVPGSGACVASGGLCTKDFTLNSATSLTWNYKRQVVFYSTFPAAVPASVRNGLDPYPPECSGYSGCANWYDYQTSQTPSVNLKAQDNNGIWWVCYSWQGSLNDVSSSGTGTSAPAFAITAPSYIQWNCGQVRSLEVTVTGLTSDMIAGFSPTVAVHDVGLGNNQLSAPEVIYDTSGDNRYVLVAYSYNDGTNTTRRDVVPADDECAADGTKFCDTVSVSANSIFNWHYRKEVKLSVIVNGLASPSAADARECGGVDNADLCIGWANTAAVGAVVSASNYYPENTTVVATALSSIGTGGGTKTLIAAVVYGATGATEHVANGRKAFTFVVMNPVRLTWLYEETDIYDVGQPIAVPAGAKATERPVIAMPGVAADAVWDTYFYWGGYPRKLYAIQPMSTFSVSWQPLSGTIPVNSRPSLAKWPDALQTHVMNAPVGLKPPGSPYSFARIAYSSLGAQYLQTDNGQFNVTAPGLSVLLFVTGPVADEMNYPVNFVVVETIPWDDSRVVELPSQAVPIGAPLTSASLPLTKNQPALGAFTAGPVHSGNRSQAVALADFNEDGLLDMAAAEYNDGAVGVYLGKGDGSFESRNGFPVGSAPNAVIAADFNGDGHADLAVEHWALNGQTSVLLGAGDGTFAPVVHYAGDVWPRGLVAGDFDGDGILDIVVANTNSINLSFKKGNGNGTFQASAIRTVGDFTSSVVAGDFNGDGYLDLAATNPDVGTISVLLGNGNGTFQTRVAYTVGTTPQGVAIGRFNNDAHLDLAVANAGSTGVSLLLGNGDGSFLPAALVPTTFSSLRIAAALLDADGLDDLIVTHTAGGEVSALRSVGDGTFAAPVTYAVGTAPYGVAAGDLTGDGVADLAVSRNTDGSYVLLGTATPFLHADPEGKNGFVMNERSFYDGAGEKPAYDRDTRTGRIIPVNKAEEGDRERQMVVVWYQIGANGLGWPVRPVRYLCDWPAGAEQIDIASGLGYGPLNPSLYPGAFLYVQPSESLAGYNPNEEHALIFASTVYAARDDLNTLLGVTTSAPYVLVKYADTSTVPPSWAMKVLAVTRGSFAYDLDVGSPLQPPAPLSLWIPYPPQSAVVSGGKYQHRTYNCTFWAIASNVLTEPAAEVGMQWYYPIQPGFYYPDYNRDGQPDAADGEPIPFLNGGQHADDPPLTVIYRPRWPAAYNALKVGQTLTTGGNGLPDVFHMAVAKVIYDEGVYRGLGPLAKLIEPLAWRQVSLGAIPADVRSEKVEGRLRFPDLPFYLRSRLSYNELNKKLIFEGTFDDSQGGDPFLLLDVMNLRERAKLCDPDEGGSTAWVPEILSLFDLSRNPRSLAFSGTVQNPYNPDLTHSAADWQTLWGIPLGLDQDGAGNPIPLQVMGVNMALTAGMARGEGWVVLVENDEEELGQKPAVHVLKVEGPPYRGEIVVVDSVDNVFDEKLTLRHTGDFGGEPERFCFEWRIAEDVTGIAPLLPTADEPGPWQLYDDGEDPCGKLDITVKGSNPRTLMDNWVTARYDYEDAFPFLSASPGYPWSQFTPAQLAQGWIKRVVSKLNPFEARVKNFRAGATNNLVSMIGQLGGRYEGPIAMNSNADNLNSLGLIEAYETVLRQGLLFSIDAVPPVSNESVNKALLFITSRLADFWALLGNEAYADAVDPTIGIDTESAAYGIGSIAPAIFAFQNQVDSLLEEELTLLRGRDDTSGRVDRRPVYNHLTWNFSGADGEVAYATSYNIPDWNEDGLINETDAEALYPQGHGDAWGHYLSGMTVYYRLLGHPHYDWVPRAESVLIGGAPVLVDFQDERKFAAVAANKARAGYDIVDLTYRQNFVDDPAGQWQGYVDTYAERAWGVDDWARRAGQGALFDWVAANAILPENALNQDRTDEEGNPIPAARIQQIMRSKVPELDAVAGKFQDIQALMDKADRGLNPLGLAKGSVPFDISPSAIMDETHFEQVYARAEKAIANAVTVFDYANAFSRLQRRNQENLEDFRRSVSEQERDYVNRLIEIYGYPYPEDTTYADGYSGPDLFHFMYMAVPELTGELPTTGGTPGDDVMAFTVDFNFDAARLDPDLGITQTTMPVTFNLNTERSWLEKPDGWSQRRAPGQLQMALSELIKAHADYQRGLTEYDGLIGSIYDKRDLLEARYDVAATQIELLDANNQRMHDLDREIRTYAIVATVLRRAGEITKDVMDAIAGGLSGDTTRIGPSIAVGVVGASIKGACDIVGDAMDLKTLDAQMTKEEFQRGTDVKLAVNDSRYEVLQLVRELQASVSSLIAKKQELYLLKEVILQNVGQYQMLLAEGERLLSEREQQRKYAAADVQDYRYQDMAYRVFRNDALQKYRAQFDVAARYVYLAATAYDYETNLLGSSSGSGRRFLTDIVRQRSLGQFLDGVPVAGQPGLCDPLARLSQNFDVYKTQLGFNNPQYEGNRFSLKKEMLRLADGDWPTELAKFRIDDLWQVPEFKRFCRPFAAQSLGAQPAIVIPFSTTVTFGENFFGLPLGGGDSAYDPTNFATKIRSVGVWFEDYDAAGLSYTPRVYLVPVGVDVLRSPTDDTFATREWKVVDQKLPVPFPIGESDLLQAGWIPLNDTLGEDFGGLRRSSSFRAYHDSEDADWHDETTQNSRLVGRSVWNTRWLLIIPGGTLLYDPAAGLDKFIETVSDIKLTFSTYAYSGN